MDKKLGRTQGRSGHCSEYKNLLLWPGIAPRPRQGHSLFQPLPKDHYFLPLLVFCTSALIFVKYKLSVVEINFPESET
jgi:hypothetical protein